MPDKPIRLAVVSDSHGDHDRIFLIARRIGQVDAVCFLGDVVEDGEALRAQMAELGKAPAFYIVRGNNDFSRLYPSEMTLSLGGYKILLTHGHMQGVKQGLSRLSDYAQQKQMDLALFGHTHIPQIEEEHGLMLVNPGSASFRAPTFAVVTLGANGIAPEIVLV